MKIGIISVADQPPSTGIKIPFLPTKPYLGESFGQVPRFQVAHVGLTGTEYYRKSPKAQNNCIKRAEKLLNAQGMDVVITDYSCKVNKPYMNAKSQYTAKICAQIPASKMEDAFWSALDKCHKYGVQSAQGILHIVDRNLSVTNFDLLSRLCMSVKYIYLHTESNQAQALADRIEEEFGLFLHIESISSLKFGKTPDLMIDMDNRKIRIGRDYVINTAEFSVDTRGYQVDLSPVTPLFSEDDLQNMTVKSFC